MTVDPNWSLDALLRDFRPHESWQSSFAEAYEQAMESPLPEQRLYGWITAAMILGDMGACVLCLFVCYYGRSLVSPDSPAFLGNIDLCLWDMKLATPVAPDASTGAVPVADMGKLGTFRRDTQAAQAWLDEQLRPFGGDVAQAAHFAMRFTAIRIGLLRGPAEPSIEQVLDASLWQRAAAE